MDTPGLTIYNLPPMPPNWDKVGVFYVSFCAVWTAIVLAGMAFCWYNRHLPILKVRGLPLAFGSVIFLHLYWIMAQITYPIGRTMPVVIAYVVQYFVMGIWFPLGIALFHAANLRFLRVAKLQRQFARPALKEKRGCNGAKSSWLCRFRNMEYTLKVMTLIITGVIVQTLLCIAMWAACKKYHPSFGIPGTEIRGSTLPEQLIDLGRGWEWWPSVLWQLIWTWMVAPILIWRAWDIHDTMGWRTQTIGACLSGLHATPMFLIASYVPAFNKINPYFTPSQWIHLNTMFIEVFTVFVPVYHVIQLSAINRKAKRSSRAWDTDSETATIHTLAPSAKTSTFELVEKDQIFSYVADAETDRLYTMAALNRVLTEHPTPLQEFSAFCDFSGENIAFLTTLAKWKQQFPTDKFHPGSEQRIDIFNAALRMYIEYVSPRDAEFPLNLSSQHLKHLEDIFEAPARTICGDAKNDFTSPLFFDAPASRHSDDTKGTNDTLYARYTGPISGSFGIGVFDEVEKHVKDLVLTNTWPKFVREMQLRRRKSVDSERSAGSDASEGSVMSRMTRFAKSLV